MVAIAASVGCKIGATHCDPSAVRIALTVPEGQQSLVSYQLSGGCVGGGDATQCHPTTCGSSPPSCPCTIDVAISGFGDPTCHIDVTSHDGAHFQTEVPVTFGSGPCPLVFLVDAGQASIEVTFLDGGVDSPDGAEDR